MRWKAFAIGFVLVIFGAACSEDETPTVPTESAAPSASVDADAGSEGEGATSPVPTGDASPTKKSVDPGGAVYDEKPSDDDRNNP